MEVDDLFRVNTEPMMLLYKKYVREDKGIRGLTIDDLFAMFFDCNVTVSIDQISLVFGMSKQTVVNDNEEKGQAALQKMQFVEFLEFIGRISMVKFLGTEMEELSLTTKIAYIMDDMFPLVGLSRNEVQIEEEEVSESDTEY